ncbi:MULTISPECIES: AraC family transcriptional regulator ligand-binding domain-containing protein [Streptomyces]|uniref:AraC family transcriptional regulator ligand-binding domain-containing protein n=1 Tax=Streptomyces TaxID=1883 RepID=UPI00167B1355|nr:MULTISPECIES: helix-turn-helix domain-containing protein [Streptomyces]MBD3578781.1 AraC family transcriptional regulator ligand-binding domain-containing protein [Streptomyces sp. KD18]GGS80743.1 AraC family transcriptional regulator [Streptomyces toxytricini]
MNASAIDGTVSAHLARSLVGALASAGRGGPARRPDLAGDVLGNDLARVSTPSLISVWEDLVLTDPRTLIGPLILQKTPIGAFGVWDYLVTTGPTLRESLTGAVDLIAAIGDPAAEKLLVEEDGHHFTVRHATGTWGPDVVQAVDLFALSLFLTRARHASGRDIAPAHVTITHRPPAQARQLARLFGTDRIHFDAPYNSISFREDDLRAPLPAAQPGLDRLLARHAERVLAESRPVPLPWLDRFRTVLAAAFREDALSLAAVAHRLAMSPRTLQRRLAENGTTWRGQVEAVRQKQALELLRTTGLPLRSIADRVGYADVRALRRAVRRWEGSSPREVRGAADPAAG